MSNGLALTRNQIADLANNNHGTIRALEQIIARATSTGLNRSIETITADTSALTADSHTVLCDCTSGVVTVTLPTASSSLGQIYVFKKIDATGNAMTIDGNGTETIDGATTQSKTTQYDVISVQSDGGAWWTI